MMADQPLSSNPEKASPSEGSERPETLFDRRLLPPGTTITMEGGRCPVQVTGLIDGAPFYFRARGSRWRLEVSEAPLSSPDEGTGCVWQAHLPYGSDFEAGNMIAEHVGKCLGQALRAYLDDRSNDRLRRGVVLERESLDDVPSGPERHSVS
jgi:hypothetical protein